MKPTRLGLRAVALTLATLMLWGTAAFADSLVADSDGLAPVNNNNASVSLGNVCAGSSVSKTIVLAVKKGASAPTFANSSSVSVTVVSATNGLSATAGAAAIALPANWTSYSNNAMSDTTVPGGADRPAGRTSSTITFATASLPLGTYNGQVDYRAAAGSLATTDKITWHATIVTCDSVAPTLNLPAPITLEATGPSGATGTYTVTATDNQDPNPTVTCSPVSGSTFSLGTTTVSCTARDASGNTSTGSFTITVLDTTPPVVTVPANVEAEATGPSGAIVTYSGQSAGDTVSGSLTPACSPASGSLFPVGSTPVTCSATDVAGNTGSQSFQVIVKDSIAPVLVVPADFSQEATGPSGAAVSYTATASDTVDGSFTPTCFPASGSTFPLGPSLVSCTATDAAGNSTSASFTITVVDTTPPVVTVPLSFAIEATGPSGAATTFASSATDAVSGSPATSCSPASGSILPLGPTPVTCTATDAAGNTGTASFVVTVEDKTPPALHLPDDLIIEATGPSGATAIYSASATDLVDEAVTPVCVPASGSTFGLGLTPVTCRVTDDAGNEATGSFDVTVEDTTAPAITVPPGHTAEATGPLGAAVSYEASATDLVDGDVTPACSPASGSTFPLGTTPVTCTAADLTGNTDSKSFTITVRDTTPPTITFVSKAPASAWANGPVTVTWSCTDIVSVVSETVTTTVSTEGASQAATGTCTDGAGLTASDTQSVSIDLTKPTIALPATGTVVVLGSTTATGASCSDALSGIDVCTAPTTFDASSVGAKTLTASATDVAGNTHTASTGYTVRYAASGLCKGSPGRTILAPVNADGSSVYKKGSTVPAKFRVCDAQGHSIGTPGVVTEFKLIAKSSAPSSQVNEDVVSTTPDVVFRWSASDEQWIFNISTSNLTSGIRYTYRISLNDGSAFDFSFSIR